MTAMCGGGAGRGDDDRDRKRKERDEDKKPMPKLDIESTCLAHVEVEPILALSRIWEDRPHTIQLGLPRF